MKFELKDMYGFLLSHTLPGLLVLVEILLCLQWCAGVDAWNVLKQIWSGSAGGTVFLLILGYAFSTLLGNILDATHHIIEDIIYWKEKEEKFNAISDSLRMDIYKHFLEDDLWYPYEQYANIGVAMIPGLFLLWHWLSEIKHFCGSLLWFPILIYGVVLIVVCLEAICTHRRFRMDEKEFIIVHSSKQRLSPAEDQKR